MIVGRVSGRHAIVPLMLRGPNGQGESELFLDTGFAGTLTLPPDVIAALGLQRVGLQPSLLADHTRVLLDIYRLTILWDGEELDIETLEMDGAPLLGMALLEGFDVRIQVTENGLVTIERL
jgi:clan AA aspartic protease